jgi:hypothetical protein
VLLEESPEGTLIAIHVEDHATRERYRVLVPGGSLPYGIAELLIGEIRSHRAQAGVESWQRILPGAWLRV